MQAVVYSRYGGPEVLSVAEVVRPAPKDGEVLIRVHAASVTTADCAARKGKPAMARLAFGLFGPKYHVLGSELSGVVEQCGGSVTQFAPGDQVYAATGDSFGAHAEYICLPQDGALAKMPGNVTFEDAAALCEGVLTALPFLRDWGRLEAGMSVLINGASGAVGTTAVQLAAHFGAEVTAVCGTRNTELVRMLGAQHVIDYSVEDFTQSDREYDIVFDAVGKSSFPACRRIMKPSAVYLTTVPTFPAMLRTLFTSRSRHKRAQLAFAGLRPPAARRKDLEWLTAHAEAGNIRPIIDRVFPLDQIAGAHAYVDGGHKTGHVLLQLHG